MFRVRWLYDASEVMKIVEKVRFCKSPIEDPDFFCNSRKYFVDIGLATIPQGVVCIAILINKAVLNKFLFGLFSLFQTNQESGLLAWKCLSMKGAGKQRWSVIGGEKNMPTGTESYRLMQRMNSQTCQMHRDIVLITKCIADLGEYGHRFAGKRAL
jgi:hypothetical protein